MNKNIRRVLAFMLAFVMVFAAAVPVLATNTDNTNAANNPPILKLVDGKLWFNFSVNHEKSRIFYGTTFQDVFDADNNQNAKELKPDADGNVKQYVEFDNEIFVSIFDKDNAQTRYWRISLANSGLVSEELNSDGTSKGVQGWAFDDLGHNKNIQPVKESEQVNVTKPAKFCVRFFYSDPNAAQDKYALYTNLQANIYHMNGNDKDYDVKDVEIGTDGKLCFTGNLVVGKDYYVEYKANGFIFETPAELNDEGYAVRKLFHVQTKTKLVDGAKEWVIERDEKGNQTNTLEFGVRLTPVELGQYLIRAIGTNNQPVRKVQFGIYVLDQTDAFHYKKDQDGNLILKNPDAPIYVTEPTNWNGYTGIKRDDILVNNQTGVVSIVLSRNTDGTPNETYELRTGEILGVKAIEGTFQDEARAAESGYKYNGNVYPLNLWKIKDVKRYNEAQKKPSIDPKEVYELREDKVVVTVPFADLYATIRVKIFNAGRTPQVRQPVTGAKVGLYENGNTMIGEELKLGKELLVKETDNYGIVEFKGLPISNVKTFFYPELNGGNAYRGVSMPYMIKQLDTGNHEGLAPYPNIITTQGYFETENGSSSPRTDLTITRSEYGSVLDIEIENHADFFGMDNRVAGKDRFETAVAIADKQFPNGLEKKDGYKNVVVAEVGTFADALTAGVVAYEYNAPLLMVTKDTLPEVTAKYIADNAERVIIVGGPNTISNKTADEIRALGVVVKRISGDNRFGTAQQVGEAFRGLIQAGNQKPAFNLGYDTKATVFLANAYNFADALTASVPAAYYGIPILLTHGDKLAPETIQALKDWDIEKVIIVGGENSVSKKVENELANLGHGYSVERFFGATRQLTSMKIAGTFFEDVTRVFFANGTAFADALAAAPFGARVKAPIILVERDKVSEEVVKFLKDNNISEGTIFGGTDQISTNVREQLANILNLRTEYPGIH